MTLQSLTLTLFALAAGAMIALQAPINAQVADRLGHPLAAATMSFCVGTVALIVFTFVFANQSTHLGALKHLPLYMLLGGGLLGAFYVTMALILAPRIGIAAVMALGIAGQLVAALLLDRFGMFGLLERGLTTGRVGGVVLVFAGALMVRLL